MAYRNLVQNSKIKLININKLYDTFKRAWSFTLRRGGDGT